MNRHRNSRHRNSRHRISLVAAASVVGLLAWAGRADVPATADASQRITTVAAQEADGSHTVTTTSTTDLNGTVTTVTVVTRTTTTTAVRPAPTPPVVIPIEVMPSGHIALMAKFNGRGPYRFVFDTGAPMLVISEHVAKASGVLGPKFQRPFFTLLGNLGEHVVKSIDINGGRREQITTTVWNHPTVDLLSRVEGPLEGLIGFPFFAHFSATIDYKAKTITLVPSDYQPTDTQEKMRAYMTGEAGEPTIAPVAELGVRLSKAAHDDAAGVTVSAVLAGGPAAEAGLKVGDRLLTLDDRWTDSVRDGYTAAAAVDPAAKSVAATLTRDGKPMTVRVAVRHGV